GSVTNDNTPTISGTAQANATVAVFDGVTSLGTTVATGGAWSLTPAVLADGPHSLTATATDVGGTSPASTPAVTFTVDTQAPAAPVITAPTEGQTVTTATPTITGTAEANALVEVFDGVTSLGTTVATGGAWSLTPAVLADGPHSLTAVATDAAGNSSAASTTINFTVSV
ncbi:MAG: Ig-like domain-containing protein, partial [Gemmatimonadota bacterium]|nr:Ig-like domain-containing protein [Gemmatimonadota bacterium]